MTAALQFEAASPLLEWLPGETLFSLASRHDRLWGYASSWRATVLLFGGRHAGTHHDFPNALGEFATRTEGVFGDAGRIARERTLRKRLGATP